LDRLQKEGEEADSIMEDAQIKQKFE